MRTFIAGLFLLSALAMSAQVTGRVSDSGGNPIAGANLIWLGTSQGTTSCADGTFSLVRPGSAANRLVVSFIGFENDTVDVSSPSQNLLITLREGVELSEVDVTARQLGTMKMRNSVLNEDMISSSELLRAACCNLGESFTTNPSVDVSYSDAATGAKQIKLLGLSGTYVQMLTENIPNFRGTASPYSLGYVPGPWMQSIQVSKGSASVKNGHEAITGQINIEFKKPQNEEADYVSANLFGSTTARVEANADATMRLGRRWSTSLLAHYENEKRAHDGNGDGFADIPQVEQANIWSRWVYMGDRYVFQAGVKVLGEDRQSGQVSHHSNMTSSNPYKVDIDTRRYEAFTKNAYILSKETGANVALILAGSLHQQDAAYGYRRYEVDQWNAYASLMFESDFAGGHSLSAGLSFNYDSFDQHYRLDQDASVSLTDAFEKEVEPGAYVQYTYNLNDKLILMAGLRADHSNRHGTFVTPRFHVKYNPSDLFNLRLSAGKGYRTTHLLAENNYLLASSRQLTWDSALDQDEAWNYGVSASLYLPIADRTLNLNAEYYYTDFLHQVVTDMDSDPHAVSFYNLSGRSYSHVVQVDATYLLLTGLTVTAAYRWTEAKTNYSGSLLSRPLTGRYKGLLTLSYQTPLALWQFDVTLQLNGGGRMPTPYTDDDGALSWSPRYHAYEQLSAQVTRFFRHWSIYIGGENLTAFKQKSPIIAASDPWGSAFDATMVWGPMHGAKGYIGIRWNLPRL